MHAFASKPAMVIRQLMVCSVLASGVVMLASCSAGRDAPVPSASVRPASAARVAGGYKVGAPYRIGMTWYVPREEPGFDRVGVASWYGADFHGRLTANGEIYDMNALTAAHPTLPLPSYVTVTNLANNRTILVRVNDRGPYVNGRLIDLSRAAARALGFDQRGIADVRVRYAGRAPLDGDTRRERQFLAGQPWYAGHLASAGDATSSFPSWPKAFGLGF